MCISIKELCDVWYVLNEQSPSPQSRSIQRSGLYVREMQGVVYSRSLRSEFSSLVALSETLMHVSSLFYVVYIVPAPDKSFTNVGIAND